MNLNDVIEGLVDERGLDRELVTSIVCESIQAAYEKKFPSSDFVVLYNKKGGNLEIFSNKKVVSSVLEKDSEISARKARVIEPKASLGDVVRVPFEESIGRIEILMAKQIIASKIRSVEQLAVYDAFKDKKDSIVTGTVHKREYGGWVVKIGDVLALLPRDSVLQGDSLRVGGQIRALLKEVLQVARRDYQLFLDRTSPDFVQKLIETEIPEVFEGIVEIKKVVRKPGYKTKVIVTSTSKEIDPVGTCVGVGGVRIKPILRELGQEKIDLIESSNSLETLVRNSLKPAEIDKVEVVNQKAIVWLAQDQRSLAIGRLGQNISLASRLLDLDIQLQSLTSQAGAEELSEIDESIREEVASGAHGEGSKGGVEDCLDGISSSDIGRGD